MPWWLTPEIHLNNLSKSLKRKYRTRKRLSVQNLAALSLILPVHLGIAQETSDIEDLAATNFPKFGGPSSVPAQLEENARDESITGFNIHEGYFDWKDRLREEHGLSYTFDYTSGIIAGTNSLSGEDFFASGAFRFYGSWDLIGRGSGNTGKLVWKGEHRHGYTDPPYNGAAADLGYAGALFNPLSDVGTKLTNLYWQQNLMGGRLEIVGGFIDATDYVDLYALASPWNAFSNWALATGSGTIGVPDDAALGVYVNAMITDHLYISGGIADANADSSNPFDGFDTFFNDREYFKSIELGWTTSHERFYLDNVHLTFWHVDERERAGTSEGWGLNFSYAHSIGDKWMPFLRGGYAEDGASVFQKSVTTGVAYHLKDDVSLVGLGLNWGEPNEDTFGSGLGDQYAMELFARLRVMRNLEVIPNIHFIGNPALDPDEDSVLAFGLRARLFF